MLSTLFPSYWKISLGSFIIGHTYICLRTYHKYDKKAIPLIINMTSTTVYFGIIAYTLNFRLRKLYSTIISNETLIAQNAKVIKAFPHAVVIDNLRSNKASRVCFTNDTFNNQVRNIRNRVAELANVEVSFPDSS